MATIVEKERTRVKSNTYRARITKVVKKLLAENELYREEYKPGEALERVMEEFSDWLPEQIMAMSDHELKHEIDQFMAFDLACGMLNDLSPEQMKTFDDAVAGR